MRRISISRPNPVKNFFIGIASTGQKARIVVMYKHLWWYINLKMWRTIRRKIFNRMGFIFSGGTLRPFQARKLAFKPWLSERPA